MEKYLVSYIPKVQKRIISTIECAPIADIKFSFLNINAKGSPNNKDNITTLGRLKVLILKCISVWGIIIIK